MSWGEPKNTACKNALPIARAVEQDGLTSRQRPSLLAEKWLLWLVLIKSQRVETESCRLSNGLRHSDRHWSSPSVTVGGWQVCCGRVPLAERPLGVPGTISPRGPHNFGGGGGGGKKKFSQIGSVGTEPSSKLGKSDFPRFRLCELAKAGGSGEPVGPFAA